LLITLHQFLRDKDPRQVVELFQTIDCLVESNEGGHYTNQMYEEAEREIREVEKKRHAEALAQKQAQYDRIVAEVTEKMSTMQAEEREQEQARLNQTLEGLDRALEKEVENMREAIRSDVLQTGFFGWIGYHIDRFFGLAKDVTPAISSVMAKVKELANMATRSSFQGAHH